MIATIDPFLAATVASVLLVATAVGSQVVRGRRRLLLQRIGIYGAVPSITAVLVLAPIRYNLTFSDGLSVAGLGLTLLFAAGASFMTRVTLRLRIGVVIPSRVPFHSELRAGLNESLQGERCDVHDDYLLTNRAVENLADFLPALRRTLQWRPDYLVICSPSVGLISSKQVTSLMVGFTRRGGGIVFVDNSPSEDVCRKLRRRYGSVTSDVETGAMLLAQWVKSRMAADDTILVLAGPSSSAPAEMRRKLFETALPGATVEVADTGAWTSDSTYHTASYRLRLGERPRFIVCGNDVMALGAVRALREFEMHDKRQLPSMEVIGYDGIARALFAIAEPTNPLCATIRTPPSAYGQEIAAMVIEDSRAFPGRNLLREVSIPTGEGQLITRNNVELVLEA